MAEAEPNRGVPENGAKCCTRILSDWGRGHPCKNTAKVTENGKPYCGVHDPARDRAKRAKWHEEWKAEREESDRRHHAAQRDAARLDLWPEVVKALGSIADAGNVVYANGVAGDILARIRKIDDPAT